MEKIIIIAGSPNSGKTCTANLLIQKLVKNCGYCAEDLSKIFWNIKDDKGDYTFGGNIILRKESRSIYVMSYGDSVSSIENGFSNIDVNKINVIVCCSHATKGKKVFEWFYKYLNNIDFTKVQVIPIYKNLLAHLDKYKEENESLADFLLSIV